jgi:hypothetical protein
LTSSLNNANNANKQPNQINRNANDLVQKISRQDIISCLINWLFKQLMACNPTESNLARCHKWLKTKTLGNGSAATNGKKAELKKWLFNMLLGRDVELTTTTSETQNTASVIAIKMMILYEQRSLV